jgi:enhancer of polycomb-like protein
MSKPTFRARTLDSAKPMPILRESREELTPEIVAQMSTSALTMQPPVLVAAMDKEEERETHLQRALDAQQVLKVSAAAYAIPIHPPTEDPEAYLEDYEAHHRDPLRPPKQYINLQALLDDEGECYEYDLDSEDEAWLDDWTRKQPSSPQLSARHMEAALQRFEQSSERTVCSLDEARALAKDLDEDTVLALYNHWTAKRQRLKHPLLLEVRTEKHDGSNSNNPYIAFRKRCEKMQTRKNRKNDELSYIRMLRLRRDMERAMYAPVPFALFVCLPHGHVLLVLSPQSSSTSFRGQMGPNWRIENEISPGVTNSILNDLAFFFFVFQRSLATCSTTGRRQARFRCLPTSDCQKPV